MKRGIILFIVIFCGCTLLYKLKAKKWGEEINRAMQIIQEVGGQIQANPMSAMDPNMKSQYLGKISEAQTIIQTVSDQVKVSPPPASLREAWETLDKGLDELLEGLRLFSSAINLADYAKGQLARSKIESATAKLKSAKSQFVGE